MTQKIEYKDIRVGDTVRTTLKYPGGDTVQTQGVVVEIGDDEIHTQDLFWPSRITNVTYELLDRPLDPKQIESGGKILNDLFGPMTGATRDSQVKRLMRAGVVFPVE